MSRRRELPTVHVVAPRCPHCGGGKIGVVRCCGDQGDGSILRLQRCADCDGRFWTVAEPQGDLEISWPDTPPAGVSRKTTA